jgi:hypothetical protein
MSAEQDGRTDSAVPVIPVPPEGPGHVTRMLMAAVSGYRRFLSPLLPPRCRFEPSRLCEFTARSVASGWPQPGSPGAIRSTPVATIPCHPAKGAPSGP